MPKKLLLVILSAILMPVVASAQSFLVDYFPVLVYGDTDIYKQVFNGVAVMFNNKTTVGFVTNVVGILAFIMIVWRLTFRHGSAGGGETGAAPWEMFFKQFAFLCIIMFVFLNPAFKSTVTIIDQRTFFGKQTIGGGASKIPIDNVPTVLAFVASGTSYLGYALVNLVDTAFASSKINGARYSDIGFMTNFSSLDRNKMLELPGPKNQAPNEERAIKKLIRFIEKCALPYEEITGDRLQAMEFGSSSYTGLDPNTWRYKDRIKHLEAERGVSCLDYYNNIDGQVTDAFKTWEKRAILSMGLNPGTAGPALKAMGESTLAAPDNVAGKKTNMSGLLQYHLRSSMDKAVAAARYNDSLGVTGASAEAINQSILSANAKMADITSQVRFLFSAQTLPKALHILIAILYAIFPFMLVVVAIRGYPEGLKVLYYFAGGMLSMELIKMSMALIHGIVSHITATNGAEILGAATGGNGQTVDYNNIVHGEAYFRYMAEQATLAADIGTAAMFMIPMVIATGQVKLLGSALGGAVTGHAPNATMQSANAEMAKANDAENRGADKVVEGYAAAAVMKGIEENNAAIASLSKMDLYNDFNKGQIGQQRQQIGTVAGYGSELKSEQDFAAVTSGGMFQGVQSAANMKSLGQEFESEQNFLNGKHSDGRSLARTLGNDATAKTIGSARGLMAGDFFNEHGDFDTAREGNIYRQGLENQARISANQTAGVGKLGEFTREQMNAIQYGAEAGALNQIAQGKALMDVHNRGQAFQDSYSKTAYMNAHQSLSQQKGSAQAYDKETHGGDIKIAESMGRVSNATALRGHAKSIQAAGNEENIISANAGDAAEKTLQQVSSHIGKSRNLPDGSANSRNPDGGLNLSSDATIGMAERAMAAGLKQSVQDTNYTKNVAAAGNEMKKEVEEKNLTDYIDRNTSFFGGDKTAGASLTAQANSLGRQLSIHEANGGITSQADWDRVTNLKDQAKKVNLEAALKEKGKNGVAITRALDALAVGDTAGIVAGMSSEGQEFGLNGVVGNFTTTNGGGIQGGIQSGVSYSHNESRNYSFGTNVSGGSAIAGAALSMGMSASTYGAISSGVAAAGQVAGAAAMFLPGGAMGKGLANMGLIGSESGYAMGIGAARAANSKNAASAVSSANAYMDRLGSFNAGGGLGQLRANYELAERGFNNIALSGSPKEVMNARMAMEKARKAYNKGLATEESLNRQLML